MRDSEIEQWVLNEIRLRTGNRLKELCVFSLEGVVNLMGTVQCSADRRAAQEAAERAKGVVEVINQLNLRSRNLLRRRPSVKSQPVSSAATFLLAGHQAASGSHAAN